MPPQQTNLTPETERDASAAMRPDVPMAALGDTLSETAAAGLAAASTRSILSLLSGYWCALQERLERQRLRTCLHDLSERELRDIGITAGEIEYIAAHRAIDRLKDSLIMSRGVM
jgi:uncharacterized protein YjiS (DUF1127 family)